MSTKLAPGAPKEKPISPFVDPYSPTGKFDKLFENFAQQPSKLGTGGFPDGIEHLGEGEDVDGAQDGEQPKVAEDVAPNQTQASSSSMWNYFLECCINLPIIGRLISCICGYTTNDKVLPNPEDDVNPARQQDRLRLEAIVQAFNAELTDITAQITAFNEIQNPVVKLAVLIQLHGRNPESQSQCSQDQFQQLVQLLSQDDKFALTEHVAKFVPAFSLKKGQTPPSASERARQMLQEDIGNLAVFQGLQSYQNTLVAQQNHATHLLIVQRITAGVPEVTELREILTKFRELDEFNKISTIRALLRSPTATVELVVSFMDLLPEEFYIFVQQKFLEMNMQYTMAALQAKRSNTAAPVKPAILDHVNEESDLGDGGKAICIQALRAAIQHDFIVNIVDQAIEHEQRQHQLRDIGRGLVNPPTTTDSEYETE